jgi:spore coat polysaccharide biosynthesis predicted glycosyltransferase SpsG
VSGCDLLLALSGGAGLGLGHVMRGAALAEVARERGLSLRVALAGDACAAAALARELPGVPLTPWGSPQDLLGARWVAFDTRREIAPDLAAVRRAGGRSLVLDRLDCRDAADLTVLPALHAPRVEHPRVLQGARYLVLCAALRAQGAAPDGEPRRGLLVSLGGADPLGLTGRLAGALTRALARAAAPGPTPEVSGVLGPAFPRRAELGAELSRLGWRVYEAPSRRELLALARGSWGAVVGFGTSVYDLAFLGVPMLYLTHHEADAEDAERLSARGIGAPGGEGPRFDPERFERALARTLLDPAWRERAAGRGRSLVGDGRGAHRILDSLEAAARPGAAPERASELRGSP